jgi:hypothetical protein
MRATSSNRFRVARVLALLLTGASPLACDTVLGLSHYTFRGDESDGETSDASASDASAPGAADGATALADASGDATTCNVDLTVQCYPCVPKVTAQFLNACTNAACVPFDDSKRVTHLLADGGLPPLPANDGGSTADGGSAPDAASAPDAGNAPDDGGGDSGDGGTE